MENQHKPAKSQSDLRGITANAEGIARGYRDLTSDDVNLMNCIKAKETEIAGLMRVVKGNNAVLAKAGPDADEAARQIAIARTEFENAFMRLVRAVARPLSPWVG